MTQPPRLPPKIKRPQVAGNRENRPPRADPERSGDTRHPSLWIAIALAGGLVLVVPILGVIFWLTAAGDHLSSSELAISANEREDGSHSPRGEGTPDELLTKSEGLLENASSSSDLTQARALALRATESTTDSGQRDRAVQLVDEIDDRQKFVDRRLASFIYQAEQQLEAGNVSKCDELVQRADSIQLASNRNLIDQIKYKRQLHQGGSSPETETKNPTSDMDWADVVEVVKPGVVEIYTDEGSYGTGFFISKKQIVTNHHVVIDDRSRVASQKIYVKQFEAKGEISRGRVYLDQERDIAILTLDNITADNPSLSLAAALPRQAEEVGALGHPKGLDYSFTDGRISAIRAGNKLSRDGKGTWVQHDAPISPGSSGGPLVNKQGEVVGMNTWFLAGDEETGGAQNLNFAISAEDIRDALQKANRRPGVRIGSGR